MEINRKVKVLEIKEKLLKGEQNLNIVDEYVDDGVSGTTFDRPQFNRLIADIEARQNKYGSNQRSI